MPPHAPVPRRAAGYDSEAAILGQHPQAVTNILNQILDVVHSAHISALLFGLFDAAKFAQGGVAGFLRIHPFPDLLLDQVFQVEAQFIAQLLFDTLTLEKRAEPQREFVEPAHHFSSQLSAVSYQLAL
jgi:hypothetical protein